LTLKKATNPDSGSDPTIIYTTNWNDAVDVIEATQALAHSNSLDHANTNDPTADQKVALAGTDGTPSASNKYVTDSDSRLAGGASVPSGLIAMWHGLIANIPSGWLLCNGSNGTPDLRDKFVKGAPSSTEAGGTGGSTILTHAGTAVANHATATTGQASAGATQRGSTTSTLTLGTHTHQTPVLTHTVTQPNNHTDVEPPYYEVLFIMKT